MSKRPTVNEFDVEAPAKKLKPADHPEGSWVCRSCQNVNWPRRTHCNKTGCNMPKDLPEESKHPEGSWACLACSNINWPKRTICNTPSCRAPRAGAPATASAIAALAGPQHPSGSWMCPSCTNVNWPARTHCNKKSCGQPKPAGASVLGMGGIGLGNMGMDPSLGYYGMMPAPAAGGHPEGSWVCPACSNINWPARTHCNKQACGQPKPAQPTPPQPSANPNLLGIADPYGLSYGMGMGGVLGVS